MLVHIRRLLLLVVPREHLLLLIHVLKWRLHSFWTTEATHLIRSEVHHALVHVVATAVLLMVKAAIVHLQIELHVRAVRRHGNPMVHASVTTHVARNVHLGPVRRIRHLL